VAIEGPLKELGLHDVFQLLDLSRKTGVLRVTSPLRRNQGTVYFDRGAVVAAEIRSNPHPLGDLLVRAGKVTESDFRLARQLQERGDSRRLGDILVEQGALTRRELDRQVRIQVEVVVFEVMGWREGHFSFAEGPLAGLRADALVRIPTEALLMEGARRIDEWSRIERQIAHLGVVPSLTPDAEERPDAALDLLPGEWEVLARIDGQRDLRSIAADLGRSEFDVAKVVFGLYSSGVVRLHDPKAATPDTASPGLEDALATVARLLRDGETEAARLEAEALVSGHPNESRVHLAAAQVQVAARRHREAEAAARRALALEPLLGPAHRLLGDALVAQGRFAEGVSWWERWLTLARHDPVQEADRARIRAATEAARTLEGLLQGGHG
jgi:hypothetical protein